MHQLLTLGTAYYIIIPVSGLRQAIEGIPVPGDHNGLVQRNTSKIDMPGLVLVTTSVEYMALPNGSIGGILFLFPSMHQGVVVH